MAFSCLLFSGFASQAQFEVSEIAKIVASDRGMADGFGWSVAIDGDYAVVGTWLEDEDAEGGATMSSAGSAYIFERDEAGVWSEAQKIVASDRAADDNFGFSVAVSGTTVMVGAPSEDEDEEGETTVSNSGSVYFFERSDIGEWNEVQKIVAGDRGSNDYFGRSIGLSGDYAIMGSHLEDEDAEEGGTLSSAGSAYIFERDETGVWNQVQKVVNSDRQSNDQFGIAVSISESQAVVTAMLQDYNATGGGFSTDAGAAYVFQRDEEGAWAETQKLVSSDRSAIDYFGKSVSISANVIAVGAWFEDHDEMGEEMFSDAGSVYVFEKDDEDVWNQVRKLVPSDRSHGDNFGIAVSVSGNEIIAGAYREDDDADGEVTLSNAGSAYVFERGTEGEWNEVQKLVASDRGASDNFGTAVAISDGRIIVGSNGEDENELGEEMLLNSGSAYLFEAECNYPITPLLEVSPLEICEGESITLEITGDLNDATEWMIYSGACGEITEGSTTESTITLYPTETTTYFVRGEGGCVIESECEAITANVNPKPELEATATDELLGMDGTIDLTVPEGTPAFTFDWDNDGAGDFDDDEDLMELGAGTYEVIAQDSKGCMDTLKITVDSQLSLEESISQNSFLIYPNPATSQFTIEFLNQKEGVLEIISTDGKVIYSGLINKSGQMTFNLGEISTGVYMVRLIADGASEIQKIIIE